MAKDSGFWERMAAGMDLPGESIPGQSVVEILGERRVLIEGHRGVREYSGDKIGVNMPFGSVSISGCDLELTHMTVDQLVICGIIWDITLNRRD